MSFKNKVSLYATLLVFSSLIFSNVKASDNSMCENASLKICNDTKQIRADREIRVKALKAEIANEANINAAPRIDEMKKNISSIHFIKRAIQTFKIQNQEIMKSAKKRISGFEDVVTNNENVSKIKNYLLQAIDESGFDDLTKTNFKETIKSIQVGNFADYIEKSGLEDSVLAQLIGSGCGIDGLVDNAFATTINNQRYVLICPGFLITLNQAASSKEQFNSILQAISHEMGHHIDNSKVGNELYSKYFSCLENNYANSFVKSKDDAKFCADTKNDKSKCNEKVVLSHSGELIADQWGIKVTALHAKAETYSFGETEQMLTDSWAKLCSSGDEGIHPTGEFRMNILMRKNPELSKSLGCLSNESSIPGCTLEGEAL